MITKELLFFIVQLHIKLRHHFLQKNTQTNDDPGSSTDGQSAGSATTHTAAFRFRKESVNDFIYSFQGWRTARAR